MSANDQLADGIRAHAIDLERFSADLRARVLPILTKLEKQLTDEVKEIDPTGPARATHREARKKALLAQTKETIATGYKEISDTVGSDLHDVAKLSDKAGRSIANKALGVEIMTVAIAPEQLRALANGTMIEGAVVGEHWRRQSTGLAEKFQDRIQQGFLRGESSTEIIRRLTGTADRGFADGVMLGQKHQAAALVRTSVQAVSNNARLEAFKANGDILRGVQWLSTMDNRTSTQCRARSMLIWDLDGRPQGHGIALIGPPAHFNCLPGDALVTPCGAITAVSKRRFDGDLVVIRTASGQELTCTPNHPILTDRGWLPAKAINQGDRVIRDLRSQLPASVIDGQDYQVPARIEEIANAFLCSGKVRASPVITTAEDFHGDGVDGEVAIIGTDRFLALHNEAPLPEEGISLDLVPGDVALDNLERDRTLGLRLHAVPLAPPSFLGGSSQFAPLVSVEPIHPSLLLGAPPTQGDAGLLQDPLYGTWADAEHIRDAANSGAAGVEFDNVVVVESRPYSGHVYNLDTETSLYIAGGIVNHNCRSTLVPVLKPWSEASTQEYDLPDGSKGSLVDLVRTKMPKSAADDALGVMQATMKGPVSADLDYEAWLKTQPPDFQLDVLGPTKHRLWTEGKITFRDLVDQTGNPLTLPEIIAKIEAGQTVIAKAEKLATAVAAVAAVTDLQAAAATATKALRDQIKGSIKAGYLTKEQGALLKDYADAKVSGIDPTIPAIETFDNLPGWLQAKVTASVDARRAALKAEEQAGPALDYVKRKAVAESAQKLKSTLHKADETAVWLPGQITDGELNGVPFKPWEPGDDFDWSTAAGKNPSLIEPPMPQVEGKKTSAGVLIIEDDGRVWIYEPTNHFGGYKHTYPKGTLEAGLDLQTTAIKEAWEESGLTVEILSHLGDYEKSNSVTRYYVAKRTGGAPWQMGWEAQNVKLVPQNKLGGFLNVDVDKTIAHDLTAAYEKAMLAGGGDIKAGFAALDAQAKELAKKAAKQKSNFLSEWVTKTAQGKKIPPATQKVFDSLTPDEQAAYAAKAAAKKADIDAGAELADIRAGQSFITQETYKEAAQAAGSGWAKQTPSQKLASVSKLHTAKLEEAAAKAKAEAEAAAAAKAAADAKALAEIEPLYSNVGLKLATGKNAAKLKEVVEAAIDKPALAAEWKAIAKAEDAAFDTIVAKYQDAPSTSTAGKAYDAILDEPGVSDLPYTKLLAKTDAKLEQLLKEEAEAAAKAAQLAKEAEEAAQAAAAKAAQEAAQKAAEDAAKIEALQTKAKPLDQLQADAQAAIDDYVEKKIANAANKPKAVKGLQGWIDNKVKGGDAGTGSAHMAAIEKHNPAGADAIKAFAEAKKKALSGITPGAAQDPAVTKIVSGIDGAKQALDEAIDAYAAAENLNAGTMKTFTNLYAEAMAKGDKPSTVSAGIVKKLPPDAKALLDSYINAKKGPAPLAVPEVAAPPVATPDAPAPKPKKATKPKTAKTIKADKGEAEPVAKTLIPTRAPDFKNLTQTGPQGGSNLGGFFTDTTTNKVYYVKAPTNEDIARNEVLAAKLYELAGVAGPKLHAIDIDGTVSGRQFKGYGIASELLEGEIVEGAAALKSAANMKENFAVDAWLANWDVTGPDYKNSVVIGGQAVRLDVGGALRYRAMGALKPNFKAPVLELESLLDPGINSATARTFGGMTTAQLEAGVSRVLSISDSDIRRMVEQFGPADKAVAKELADTLIARKQWLGEKFPHLAKPQPEAPIPEATKGRVTKLEIERTIEARSNGYTRLTDKDMIEDQHVMLWVEKDAKGKLSHTGATMKLRNAGADKLEQAIKGAKDETPTIAPVGPPKANAAPLDSAILMAVKGIASRAAKGMALEAKDIERVQAAVKAFTAFVKEMETFGYSKAEISAATGHYSGWLSDLQKAIAPGAGQPATWAPVTKGNFTGHVVPPAPVKAATKKAEPPPAAGIQWKKVAGTYEAKNTDKGWLTRTGSPLNFRNAGYGGKPTEYGYFYEAEIDGVKVRYWDQDDKTAKALQGKLELLAEGTDAASAEKMIDVIEKLGIDAERPDPLDMELRYLEQIAFNRKHKFPAKVTKLTDTKARVDAMHDSLSEAAGYQLRQSPHYNPEGVRNAFGHSRPFALRPDLDSPATDAFVQNYGFNHMAGGNGLLTMFKTIMNEGGFFAPKADFFRRGKDFTAFGMSPTADMANGGGAYVYTRVQPRTHGGSGLFWDGSLARRVDARTHKTDPVGRLLPEAQRIQADGTAAQYDKMKGTYETIFKNGISLFEHRFQLRVDSAADRIDAINWLKQQGEPYSKGLWPDGRKLEEVIVLAKSAT